MVVGIELEKRYVQICVKTEAMREPESITKIVGSEQYRIPIEADLEKKEELQELFRQIWKMIVPFGSKGSLECLIFCLEENSEKMRENLLEVAENCEIAREKVHFLDKQESFCAYVMNQKAELLSHNALLVENKNGIKSKFLLHKRPRTTPAVTEVRNVSEHSLESVFTDHAISSVFLVGDDFEESWMQKNLKLLKTGRRVFAGKNLFVKGAVYRGIELSKEKLEYFYLGEDKVCCNIGLKAEEQGEETLLYIIEGGKNWYDSDTAVEVLLLDEPKLEFAIVPMNGREKKTVEVTLENLPERPKKATRLRLEFKFENPRTVRFTVRDLGFGELFAQSDMCYEGELRWD